MSESAAQADTFVSTLHVEAPEEVASEVQLRLGAKLAGADLHPAGLGPSEVLLVKYLSDPAPGGLRVEQPGPFIDRNWERAVQETLADCLLRAVRPVDGRVPAGADVVLFRDHAEAWACWSWAKALREGPESEAWWMENLEASSSASMSERNRPANVAEVWWAHPRIVPSMLRSLSQWGRLMDVVRSLEARSHEEVLQAVSLSFGLQAPAAVSSERRGGESPLQSSSEPNADLRQRAASAQLVDESEDKMMRSSIAPWDPAVREAAGDRVLQALRREPPSTEQFVGVSLGLSEQPAHVRSQSFHAKWHQWTRVVETSRRSHGESEPPSPETDRPGVPTPDDQNEEPRRRKEERPSTSDEIVQFRSPEESTTGTDRPSDREGSELGHGMQDAASDSNSDRGDAESDDGHAVTELGGIFYLINVLSALNLPRAATLPRVGEHVGAWGVLEGLARALLESKTEPQYVDDPVWRVLAELGGRDPDLPPGSGWEAVRAEAAESTLEYRMPSEWLELPVVDSPIHGCWSRSRRRIFVWSDLGCMVDRTVHDSPGEHVEAEWTSFPKTGDLHWVEDHTNMPLAPEPSSCSDALAWWAARVAPFLRWRLEASLQPDERNSNVVRDLMQTTGTLYATDTHVDVILPLDAARIDVRRAGLDRSPGWWPAGGRVVRFHFQK